MTFEPDKDPRESTRFGLVVHAGLAAVPYVGGPLATAWSDWDTNRRFHRVNQTLAELGRVLSQLKDRLDPDHIGEAELQILESVLQRVQCEHRETKRRRFAMLIASDWTEQREQPFGERLRFVKALDECDELHLGILTFLASEPDAKHMPTYAQIGDSMRLPVEQRDEQLIPALDTLASSFGFIQRGWSTSGMLMTNGLSPEGIARKCEHTITESGRRFLRAVSLPPE